MLTDHVPNKLNLLSFFGFLSKDSLATYHDIFDLSIISKKSELGQTHSSNFNRNGKGVNTK